MSGLDVGLFVPAAGYGTSGLGQAMTIAIDVVGLGEDSGGQPSEASGRITQEFTACVTDVVE